MLLRFSYNRGRKGHGNDSGELVKGTVAEHVNPAWNNSLGVGQAKQPVGKQDELAGVYVEHQLSFDHRIPFRCWRAVCYCWFWRGVRITAEAFKPTRAGQLSPRIR